jgi:polysaccharide transporter, PST family
MGNSPLSEMKSRPTSPVPDDGSHENASAIGERVGQREFTVRMAKLFSLVGITQILNYVFPLVTIPLLAARLTPIGFARLAVLQAIFQYSTLLANFGFQWSATRHVAVGRNNSRELGAIIVDTIIAKVLLGVIATGATWIVWEVGRQRIATLPEMLAGSSAIVAMALFPTWLIQGLELQATLTGTMLVTRALTLALVWTTVHGSGDAYLAMAAQYIPQIVLTPVLFMLAVRMQPVTLSSPSRSRIATTLRDSFFGFSANVAYWICASTNVLILAAVSSPVIVAGYSGADRVIQAVRGLAYGGIQAMLPYYARTQRPGDKKGLYITLRATLVISALISVGLFVFAPIIVSLLLGPGFERSATLLRMMSPVPMLIAAGHCFATLGLLGRGAPGSWALVAVSAALANFGILATLLWFHRASPDTSVACAVIGADLCTVLVGFLFFMRGGTKTP